MTHFERDEVPMLSGTHAQQSNEPVVSNLRRFVSRTRSASIYNPVVSMEPNERETHIVFHNSLGGDANSFGRKLSSFRPSWVPGVMKPHSKAVQQWNKVSVIFCLMAIFVDPLFFFLIYVRKDYNCVAINWTMTRTLVSIRSINDFLYFLNILLQFRLAYVARSRVVDTGELVDHPKKIALNYLKGYLLFDLFVVLPLPQVRIFALMDEPILDAIRERLKQKIYIKGSRIVSQGDLVEKIVFVVHGKLESIEEDGIRFLLREGDACGQELLNWYFENSSVSTDGNKVRLPRQRFVSNRTVRCFTNVEAFSLRAADLEEVTMLFPRLLQSSRIQGALRYESPHWRSFAATQIQVAWRYRKKRRVNTSQSDQTLKSYVVL